MILVGACILAVSLIACKTAEHVVKQTVVDENTYSYVDIDPLVIGETWEHVITVPYDRFIAELYYCNPDENADIHFATLMVAPGGVIAYSYMINSKINFCQFNVEKNAYESTWNDLTDKHKAQWYVDYQKYFGTGIGC